MRARQLQLLSITDETAGGNGGGGVADSLCPLDGLPGGNAGAPLPPRYVRSRVAYRNRGSSTATTTR